VTSICIQTDQRASLGVLVEVTLAAGMRER
jgi:hypothetical protein